MADGILTEGDLYGDKDLTLSTNGIKQPVPLHKKFIHDITYARTREEQIKVLLNYEPDAQLEKERDAYRTKWSEHAKTRKQRLISRKFWTFRNYVRGLLTAITVAKKITEDHIVEAEIQYLKAIGNTNEEILYCIFNMGFRNVTINQIDIYLAKEDVKTKVYAIRNKIMNELEEVKRGIFQEMKTEVMEAEKRHLTFLLNALPKLEEKIADCDIEIEWIKWNRLNKQISNIHSQLKSMHGIDMAREVMVKAAGEVLVHKEKNALPEGGGLYPKPQFVDESKTHVLT